MTQFVFICDATYQNQAWEIKFFMQFDILILKISTFSCFFHGSEILELSTTAFTDMCSFGLVWPKNVNNIK